MKREIAFFKDKRGSLSAKNIIALYRSLGYTDEQIKEEMLKIKSERQLAAQSSGSPSDSADDAAQKG